MVLMMVACLDPNGDLAVCEIPPTRVGVSVSALTSICKMKGKQRTESQSEVAQLVKLGGENFLFLFFCFAWY